MSRSVTGNPISARNFCVNTFALTTMTIGFWLWIDRLTMYCLVEKWSLKCGLGLIQWKSKPKRTKKNCINKLYLEHQRIRSTKILIYHFSRQIEEMSPHFDKRTRNYSVRCMGWNLQIEMHSAMNAVDRSNTQRIFASRQKGQFHLVLRWNITSTPWKNSRHTRRFFQTHRSS